MLQRCQQWIQVREYVGEVIAQREEKRNPPCLELRKQEEKLICDRIYITSMEIRFHSIHAIHISVWQDAYSLCFI